MPKVLKQIIHGFHRYAGLVICVQIMLWSMSGFLMAFWSFGDLYQDPPPVPLAFESVKLNPQEVLQTLSRLQSSPVENDAVLDLKLLMLAGKPFYRIQSTQTPVRLMDQHGNIRSPLDPALAAAIAREQYLGKAPLGTIDLLPTSSGNYVSSTPVFKASFQDAQGTEIYIDPQSGALLARRKALWRWYNRMWEFHLMKYSANNALNKYLLLFSAVISFLVSLTGLFKFFRN